MLPIAGSITGENHSEKHPRGFLPLAATNQPKVLHGVTRRLRSRKGPLVDISTTDNGQESVNYEHPGQSSNLKTGFVRHRITCKSAPKWTQRRQRHCIVLIRVCRIAAPTAWKHITVSHDPEQGSSMSRYHLLAVADSCCIEILKSTTVRQLP